MFNLFEELNSIDVSDDEQREIDEIYKINLNKPFLRETNDDNIFCKKCGKPLKYEVIEYLYSHDGGIYESSYKKVNDIHAKKSGSFFYCDKCYEILGQGTTEEIQKSLEYLLDNELKDFKTKVAKLQKRKNEEINNFEQKVKKMIEICKNKKHISQLTMEEIKYIAHRSCVLSKNDEDCSVGLPNIKNISELWHVYYRKKGDV